MNNCERCDSNKVRFTVRVMISGPMKYWYKLPDPFILDKEVEFLGKDTDKEMMLLGVDWEDATIICYCCGFNVLKPHLTPIENRLDDPLPGQ